MTKLSVFPDYCLNWEHLKKSDEWAVSMWESCGYSMLINLLCSDTG